MVTINEMCNIKGENTNAGKTTKLIKNNITIITNYIVGILL